MRDHWIRPNGKFQCLTRKAVLGYVKDALGRDDIEMYRLQNGFLMFLIGTNGNITYGILKHYFIPNITESELKDFIKSI